MCAVWCWRQRLACAAVAGLCLPHVWHASLTLLPTLLSHAAARLMLTGSQGFTAVSALALLISGYLALSWLVSSLGWAARNADLPRPATAGAGFAGALDLDSQRPQQQRGRRQPQKADGLVFVLAGCLLLLCWAASARLAQYDHPVLASSSVLFYCVSVLPELVVAAVFAAPTLAARVALGGQYHAWLRAQQEAGVAAGGGSNGSGASSTADAEVGVDASSGQQEGK